MKELNLAVFIEDDTSSDLIEESYYDDDYDVTGLQATKACQNYETVWARTGPLLIQPGSNLGQGPTQP